MGVKTELKKIGKTLTGKDLTGNTVEKLLASFNTKAAGADIFSELPECAVADAGKVLTVGADGKPEWADIPAQTPAGET